MSTNGTVGSASPHSTDSSDIGSILEISGNTSVRTNETSSADSLPLGVNVSRVEQTVESIGGAIGSTISVEISSAVDGSPLDLLAAGMEACVFVPSPDAAVTTSELDSSSVPVVLVGSETTQNLEALSPSANLSSISLES